MGRSEDLDVPRLLADLATGLWRLGKSFGPPGTALSVESSDRASRHLQAIWDTLAEAGIVVHDPTGEPVPEVGAYALRAIAYQLSPGLAHDVVLETIRPSVLLRDNALQFAEVVVGKPARPEELGALAGLEAECDRD